MGSDLLVSNSMYMQSKETFTHNEILQHQIQTDII